MSVFFVFKQKTAYEMRISDWSSEVCSSDLLILDVVNAYVSLQRDIQLYGVALDIYLLLRQQRDVIAERYRLRDSTAPDVDQTNNRLELAAGRRPETRRVGKACVRTCRSRWAPDQ